ncbi:MAG: hypothetical protein KBC38_00765 [Candidatus Pacebacteria bacterium]|nr:hypothetical protein [Candidatus Paceibacterota bacterium]MBP9840528.1 hypothetical protein [Candidatus Paceibacterota bacterium]
MIELLGLLSGVLQVVGYAYYISYALRGNNTPNPLTWFMFSYGTGLLFLLEYQQGASWQLLVLPGVCAACSIGVVFICLWRGGYSRTPDFIDGFVFGVDLLLTIVYGFIWALQNSGAITDKAMESATMVIIIAWNFGVFTAFTPMTRAVNKRPEEEQPRPWIVWSAAYALLVIATLMDEAPGYFLLYPVINLFFHSLIAWMSWKRPSGADKEAVALLLRRPT